MGKKKMTSMRIDEDILTQAHDLGLNVSKVCENALKDAIRRLATSNPGTRNIPTRTNTSQQHSVLAGGVGFEPTTPSLGGSCAFHISYPELRKDFVVWLESRGLNESYRKHMIRDLDRFVGVIKEPMDIARIFSPLTHGQKHNLNRALRALLNFLESQGFNTEILTALKRNIPKDSVGIDLKIPSEDKIIRSLRTMKQASTIYNDLYNLVLDSGLRLTEAVMFSNDVSRSEVEEVNGFCVAPLGYFRTSKIAYYAFFTEETMQQLKARGVQRVSDVNARSYMKRFRKAGDVATWKYLRKFVFDKMIELEIPESVADFIQGRTPKSIGAKHYMVLMRQAKKFYPRYAEYITQLREKALS